MKKRNYIIFIISTILILSFVGCSTNKDSESVLSSNVLEDLKNDECDVMELLQRGDDCLKANDFASAKAFYEKSVIKDKMNIDTYSKIKDKYLDVNRLDDAYYFVNLAIDNSVDKNNMTKILDEIKSKFTPITLRSTIVKSSAFSLPTTVDVSVNNTDTESCDVTWNNSPNTNEIGTFTYNGFCNKYHRAVTYNLTIREPIKSHKIGFITDIYDESGEIFLKFDEAQLYLTPDNAVPEYLKDHPNASTYDLDILEYYIRNNSKETVTYKIAQNCSINLCAYVIPDNSLSTSPKSVDATFFKNYVINSNKEYHKNIETQYTAGNHGVFVWIDTEDNTITDINMQFTP
jgi:hypothetical protein